MDPVIHLSKKQLKRHILIWILLLVYLDINGFFPGAWIAKIIGAAIENLNYIVLFYGLSLYIFPKFWPCKHRVFLIFICIIVCYGLYSIVTYFNYLKIIPSLGGYSWHQKYSVCNLLIQNLFLFSFDSLAAMSYFFYQYSIYKFKWQAEKEKSLLVKELNFLKNQFNSHITFNFLNYCYSNIHRKLPKIAESIGLFSDILRYNLQSKPDEKIPLSKEIANIENFIQLHNQLYTKVYLTYRCDKNNNSYLIMSHILIGFVEQVVKNALYNDLNEQILMDLRVSDSKLVFIVKNKVGVDKKKNAKGFDNVRKLLDLHYANNYSLEKSNKDGYSTIELQLILETNNIPIILLDPLNLNDQQLFLVKPNNNTKISVTAQDALNDLETNTKPLMFLNAKQIKTHLILWVLFITRSNIVGPIPGTWLAKIIGSGIIYLNYMFIFYSISLFVFPKFWERKRISLFLSIFLIYLIDCLNSYLNFKIIIPVLGGNTYIEKKTLIGFFKSIFYFFVLTGLAGTASFFIRYGLYKLKLQAQKEKDLLLKELHFLKNQFNSDFTFNFLSYCYKNIQPHFPETAKSISYFTDMLKYTMQTGPGENVPLDKEIIYIENFIQLQKLLSTKVYANFDYKGKFEDKQILPRILVTFVENAFKHGQYNDPSQPIQMNLKVVNHQLIFIVNNKVTHNKKTQSTKKGIENVKQILELYYPGKHELKQVEEKEFFGVELKMRLNA